ncbi:Fucose permease [Pseudonocardia thermophila]|uniref:Fucose permease n=1 Tax=Pseudonocardia thermophila TaxID=1848 RepID=A0A1M6Q6N4_PSETH|nr:MFS transporter [Pseudonocardia thermophila]SHK15773.1 Fucose permease [Pseudonocardia thermophila]
MTTSTGTAADPALLRARTAVVIAFWTSGVALAALLARLPAARDDLGLNTAELGLLLLCVSASSVASLPTAGPVVARFGPARTVLGGAVLVGLGQVLAALALATTAVWLAAAALLFVGLGTGVWDVAMNVEGADVERRLGRSLMPRLHAAFSIGTVSGAGVSTVTAALDVPLAAQLAAVGLAGPVLVGAATRCFLAAPQHTGSAEPRPRFGVRDAWREPRTVLVGLMVLGFALTEGAANDWIAVALVDGHGATEAVGAVAFGCFVTAMTTGRFVGGALLDRFGRVAVLRATAVLALAGLLLVLFGGPLPVVLAGTLLWGLGASLGFPVGMSAAADDPERAAPRVSAVSSIGYVAFLAGPPLIGPLGQQFGILTSLLVVVGAVVLGGVTSGAARPLPRP